VARRKNYMYNLHRILCNCRGCCHFRRRNRQLLFL